ncbi:hypothetical protein HPB50_000595 [Hyalomma asiaticum]|uniref:Uncharacterized protein n=1 Tax=Hyalomma asiaticum TaxID=266040 RepID=A0ACB7RIA1_HYAAI|nr:hypothetical protein HPB50_000595 [Hyalomma asiaticum]
MELHEHKWGEFSLQGHPWAENEPKMPDVLHVSLLIHVLLRQHRCVTRILLDLSITRLERIVMWHALSTGALGVKRLEYKQCYLELRGLVDDTRGGAFLDHLARNRSLKTLCVHEHFLTARKGQALADVVRNHVTLEEIDVTGFPTISPTALLQAAVQSKSLRTLTVRDCRNQAQDIEALASALRLNPFPPVKDAEPASPPPRSRLRNLTFKNCTPGDYILEAAYAKLIGGKSTRFCTALVLNMTAQHRPRRLSTLFTMIHRINALSRLKLQHLMLNVTLPDADVVKLFRALERNRSVSILVICYVTFSKRNAQALGRLVENNRALLFLNINLHSSDPKVDRILQSRRICQELKETVRRNRFIASISVNLGLCDYSKDYVIKDVLGRNFMRINQALRFVEGSTEKADALAFETVQHNASVSLWLQVHRNILQESADKMVTEARRRLASNYFILVNVVKAKTVCQRNKKTRKKTLFDNLGRVLQAQIFSYLSLTDVVDI